MDVLLTCLPAGVALLVAAWNRDAHLQNRTYPDRKEFHRDVLEVFDRINDLAVAPGIEQPEVRTRLQDSLRHVEALDERATLLLTDPTAERLKVLAAVLAAEARRLLLASFALVSPPSELQDDPAVVTVLVGGRAELRAARQRLGEARREELHAFSASLSKDLRLRTRWKWSRR